MGLKYYLRGLGLGVIITAILMIVSSGGKKAEMTDAQIIARARELGMVDGVLTELPGEGRTEEAEGSRDKVQASTVERSEDGGEKAETDDAQTSSDYNQDTAGSAEPAETAEKSTAGNTGNGAEPDGQKTDGTAANRTETFTATVSIYPGEGSYMVSRKLAELGLVESADIYDRFLCQNGYDKKLCTGNYEISSGSTAEEIARIITKAR